MILVVSGTLTVDGTLTANGACKCVTDHGGGAGGTISMTIGTLAGSGVISADGGNGNGGGGGGGGGRILVSGTDTYSGTYTVDFGVGPGAGDDGLVGTIHFIP